MIIWINGAFGVGKTSVAECLSNMIKKEKTFIYDPEQIGYCLQENIPKYSDTEIQSDFQDIELW